MKDVIHGIYYSNINSTVLAEVRRLKEKHRSALMRCFSPTKKIWTEINT